MTVDARKRELIKQRLDEAERNIQYVKHVLEESQDNEGEHISSRTSEDSELVERAGERIIEGVFDGKNMVGNDGQEYPIPPNYASKSKLVEGDVMKLTIGADGSFTYKQIRPVERKRLIGTLVVDEEGTFRVKAENKLYNVLLASVTFYQIEERDEVTILIPAYGEAEWGAVEHVIHGQHTT